MARVGETKDERLPPQRGTEKSLPVNSRKAVKKQGNVDIRLAPPSDFAPWLVSLSIHLSVSLFLAVMYKHDIIHKTGSANPLQEKDQARS